MKKPDLTRIIERLITKLSSADFIAHCCRIVDAVTINQPCVNFDVSAAQLLFSEFDPADRRYLADVYGEGSC
jgi:hypothetical protein